MQHHYAAYGFWAPSVGNYTAFHLMDWDGTPEYKALLKIEEPYQYRKRFTMPKFIVNAAGDQFFLPDSSQFYFNDLPGVKYLRYVPNADHSLKGSDAYQTLLACYNAVINQLPLPQFTWTVEKDGTMPTTAELEDPSLATNLCYTRYRRATTNHRIAAQFLAATEEMSRPAIEGGAARPALTAGSGGVGADGAGAEGAAADGAGAGDWPPAAIAEQAVTGGASDRW